MSSLFLRSDQPLIGVILEEGGREVVHYFVGDEAAEQAISPGVSQQALNVIGAWGDLDWQEMAASLDRIRHESPPTPPIEL